ncbi:hypothetical protein Hdeb2414_s0122g00803501 [Helianthus debilis subsp. tardiflorus]
MAIFLSPLSIPPFIISIYDKSLNPRSSRMMKMIFFNSPISCSCFTSSAPLMYLPPMKTLGKVSFVFSLFNLVEES